MEVNQDIKLLNAIIRHFDTIPSIIFVGCRKDKEAQTSQEFWYNEAKFRITVEHLKDSEICKTTKGAQRQ